MTISLHYLNGKTIKCKSNVFKNLRALLLFVLIIIIIIIIIIIFVIVIIIINYKCTVVTVLTRWRFFHLFLFIYFEHLYIDHHLANIACTGTAMFKARGDGLDHR